MSLAKNADTPRDTAPVTENPVETAYKKRISHHESAIALHKKHSLILGGFKLALFLAAVVLLIMRSISPVMLSLLTLAFIIAALFHERVIRKQKRQALLKRINHREIDYLQHRFPVTESGAQFADPEHNYTSDLDIFGERGIFHYISRCGTFIGRSRLAQWLKTAPDPTSPDSGIPALLKKQQAVNELSEKMDFRQAIIAGALDIDDSPQTPHALNKLFKEPYFISGRPWFIFFIYFFPLLSMAALASIFIFKITWLVFAGFVAVQLVINKAGDARVSRISVHTSKKFKIIKSYAQILRDIESQSFSSPALNEQQAQLYLKEKPASFYIKKLASLLEWFEVRGNNAVHFLMNNTFFWDFHCVLRIERWRRQMEKEVNKWLDVIGNIEAFCSLGALRYNHPQWTMPRFSDEFTLQARRMGHPLIPPTERVFNDLHLEKKGDILIVTGPNMAGKSTFLRTVGVNMVLAFAGAPVCADSLTLSLHKLYTSMKISDSLDKKLSLFYAELLRLKQILDGISEGEPVFFIVDEMLKGTNTEDRRKGAIALIRQLLGYRANGIVATHDLGLAQLETDYPGSIRNSHFDSYIEDDRLFFDYTLKGGVCQSFNALILMGKMGIDIR